MSNGYDIVSFVKDPSQLVELYRNIIDQIDHSSEDGAIAEQEAQLIAIAKAIEQLEKSSIAVPDPLRAEKTRLVAALAVHKDARQALTQLASDLQDILNDLRQRLGLNITAPESKPRRKRSKLPKTSQTVLREYILQALKKLGGSANVSDVIEEMARRLEGKFLPGDTLWRESVNEAAWVNNTKWERYNMTQDGTLKQGSPRGIWELGEDSE